MKRLFDAENPLMRALALAADLMVLNLLTLVCCLPVLTAGAAFAALNDAARRMVRGEDAYLLRSWFRALKSNLWKGSALGLLFLLAAGIVWLNYRAAAAYAPPFRLVSGAVGVLVLALAIYSFALQARYENSVPGTLKNAAALAVAYFPRTLGMVVCTAAIWVAGIAFLRYALPLLALFGLSLPCYINVLLYNGILEALESGD